MSTTVQPQVRAIESRQPQRSVLQCEKREREGSVEAGSGVSAEEKDGK